MKCSLPFVAMAMLSLVACSQSPAEDEAASTADAPAVQDVSAADVEPGPVYTHDGWIGRWTGVEGMYADIQPTGDGTYRLEMQSDLDTYAAYTGTSTAEGIAFERGGESLVLRQSDGAATGLKWLDGKTDCLMVAAGEGYCRD